MVRGVIRPPAIELANRDLIEAHLNAVWLTEAGIELPSAIPNILELTDASLKARSDIETALTPEALTGRASAAMARVLDSVGSELGDRAPWAADRRALAQTTAERAFARFSGGFDRWRQLYAGARAQLEEANRKSEIQGLPTNERRRLRRVKHRFRSKSFCSNEEVLPATQISSHIAISRRRASCPATTSPDCHFMRTSRRANSRAARPHTCNAHGSSRSPNLGRATSCAGRSGACEGPRMDCPAVRRLRLAQPATPIRRGVGCASAGPGSRAGARPTCAL